MRRSNWLWLGLVFMTANALAAPQTIVSPETRVALLELYTSEGCDSCPPAEQWLSGFADDQRLWKELVPLAFHVDYWDDLGWRDRFDSHAYTLRQQAIAARAGSSVVYTPQFVLDGSDWRNWFNHRPLSLPDPVTVGSLSLSAEGRSVRVHFAPSARATQHLEVHVVLLAFGVDVHVGAGENAGAVLSHDFLVVGYGKTVLNPESGGYGAAVALAPLSVKAARYALAAWVSAVDDPEPLQAAGGWLAGVP